MDTLALMAEGQSNAGIADRLGVSERTVESLCAKIFRKLDLVPSSDSNRRVVQPVGQVAQSIVRVSVGVPGVEFLRGLARPVSRIVGTP